MTQWYNPCLVSQRSWPQTACLIAQWYILYLVTWVMAQCYSSYLVPEKILSSNPLVSRWKALSQSPVGTTSLIPIWYHKSLEFKPPRKWKHSYIMCRKALLVNITIPVPIWYQKSLEFQTHSWTGERKHCCDLFHKVWLDVMSFITQAWLEVNQFC
jgi:hypothetical protein